MYGFGFTLIEGLKVTLGLALCSFSFGLFIGLIIAIAKLSKIKTLRMLASLYTTVIRGTPELLILFLIFYGGQVLLSQIMDSYSEVPAFTAGVLGLSAVFGGYSAETLRSSFLNVDKGSIESAQSLGLSSLQVLFYIKLPLAWRLALPALGNLWMVLLKETALVSIIGLEDIMRKTQIAVTNTKKPFTFYLVAAFLYLFLTFVSEHLLQKWEKSLFRGERI
ncbi:MAG: ABC transporter permease subunit [Bdellovibrionales bacterium]|nr:ABC transporter permease subunit [Bdellovibrionales bacterium]